MENKQQGRNFGFTSLKPTEEKLEESQKPEVRKIIEGGENPSNEALEKLRALQKQHALQPMMVTVGGPIPYHAWEDFENILKEYKKEDRFGEPSKARGWSQKKLAAHYILEGIKKDLKKIKK